MGTRQLWDTFASSVLDVLFCSMVKLDLAMRDLGEEQVKDTIVEGLGHMREALGEILEHIPTEDHTQREYAREFLRITADVTSGQGHSRRTRGGEVSAAIEAAMAPLELHRVGDHFGAPNTIYTEQDITNGMRCVRMVVDDIRNILLDLDDEDLSELAQMTLMGSRILLSMAKMSHRTLERILGLPPRIPPARGTGEPADNGAGPSSGRDPEVDEAVRKLLEDGVHLAGQEWGGLPWDPLVPRLIEGAQAMAEKGKERPIVAVVVIAAVLPFSGLMVCVGAPVLAGDAALQWGAKTSAGRAVGQGAVNALEFNKFWWVAGKLATKQTFRLARQQFDRVGGAGGLACCAAEGVCWTATHPVQAAATGASFATEACKIAYGRAMWIMDLLATVREEVVS